MKRYAQFPDYSLAGEAQTLIVRGAYRNGRRTIFSAIARELNLGLLEIKGITGPTTNASALLDHSPPRSTHCP